MLGHETIANLSHKKPEEVLVLGSHRVLVVEPTQTEKRILVQSADEGREMGSIEANGGRERIILFGRPSSIPTTLFKIGIKELKPPSGAIINISHSHWETDQDIRPSGDDLSYAQQLQESHPYLSLHFRVVCGNRDKPLAFQYFPVLPSGEE